MKICSVCRRCYDDEVLSCSEADHDQLITVHAGAFEPLAGYRLEYLEESTAAAEIYRAVNKNHNKTYLIKIVAPEMLDEDARREFLREARAVSALIHPNVARVFENGTLPDGSLYVVTEFLEAQTLRECLENVGKPTETTALTIARQTAEGLGAIHAAGVSHRNLRPENIMLTTDAENRFLVKIQNCDFGALEQQQVNANAERWLDSFRYFSPEQCAAHEADAQADVYALGIVLYEMLAGQVPFDAPYADALIAKQINEPAPTVKINSFDLRMLVTHTLTDALQKTTLLRLKSANAFARQLRHIEQLATHSSTPPPAMAYPATMNKTRLAFTPPVKTEKVAAPIIIESPEIIETPVAAAPQIESMFLAEETQFAAEPAIETLNLTEEKQIVEISPTVETEIAVEQFSPAEIETVFEEAAPIEIETPAAEAAPVEIETVDEDFAPVEVETIAEEISPVDTVAEVAATAEVEAVEEELSPVAVEPVEQLSPVQIESVEEEFAPVEVETVVEQPVRAAIESAVEELAIVETETVVAKSLPFEDEVIEEPAAVDAQSFEIPVVVEPEMVKEFAPKVEELEEIEEPETPVYVDLSTTKLPPLETFVAVAPTVDTYQTRKLVPLEKAAEDTEIHQTAPPVLIEWQQPDDLPTTTQTLRAQKKESADAHFAPPANFPVEENFSNETVTAERLPQIQRTKRNDDELTVLSSYDAGGSWSVGDKRKLVTGAAVVGLLVIAVSGTFLSRQIQLARSNEQSAVKPSAQEQTPPKPAEPAKIQESQKPGLVKTENINLDNAETTDSPVLQQREKEPKSVAPTGAVAAKKRATKEPSEKTSDTATTKAAAPQVFDKKGNAKPATAQKSAKGDGTTRPRIVKNP